MLGAGLLWTVYATLSGDHALVGRQLNESVASTAQIVFFLIGAMTIVQSYDCRIRLAPTRPSTRSGRSVHIWRLALRNRRSRWPPHRQDCCDERRRSQGRLVLNISWVAGRLRCSCFSLKWCEVFCSASRPYHEINPLMRVEPECALGVISLGKARTVEVDLADAHHFAE